MAEKDNKNPVFSNEYGFCHNIIIEAQDNADKQS